MLIKIVNSTAGFPVQLVYATQGPGFGSLGSARGSLPRPDILVTHSRWDVYVPAEMSYAQPSTNLDVVKAGDVVSRDAMARQLARADGERGPPQPLDPLRISVPTAGVHYAFEKLYANQSDQDGWIMLPYASAAAAAPAACFAGRRGRAAAARADLRRPVPRGDAACVVRVARRGG